MFGVYALAVPNFIIQGGDITDGNGVGGESIYGGYFKDETFEVLHNKLYLLNMANKGPDSVRSFSFMLWQLLISAFHQKRLI